MNAISLIRLMPGLALLLLPVPIWAGNSTFTLDAGSQFVLRDGGATTRFSVDDSGTILPEVETYSQVVVVSPVGTPAQNGTALLDALADIVGASDTNRYLLRIEPGIYDLGSSQLDMLPFIDLEGSGEGITVLRRGAAGSPADAGVVRGTGGGHLRHLTIENTGGAEQSAVAFFAGGVSDIHLEHVTLVADNAGSFGYAGYFQSTQNVYLSNVTARSADNGNFSLGIGLFSVDEAWLDNVDALGSGAPNQNWGILANSSAVEADIRVSNSTARGQGGLENRGVHANRINLDVSGSHLSAGPGASTSIGLFLQDQGGASVLYSVKVRDSILAGGSVATNARTETESLLAGTQLAGGVSNVAGSNITCAGVYDENFVAHVNSCP